MSKLFNNLMLITVSIVTTTIATSNCIAEDMSFVGNMQIDPLFMEGLYKEDRFSSTFPDKDPFASDPERPFYLAQTDVDSAKSKLKSDPKSKAASAECLKFAKDPNANIGAVIKAGCKPTTAQMSTLMNNPVGNVAMWWNQYDSYHMKNDANGEEAIQGNYMGILQFPVSVSTNWNLINRIVYNVASAPIDQGKVDDLSSPNFNSSDNSTLPGHVNSAPSLIDLADGRTTGFGDMYYVGLFSPKEPIKFKGGGNGVWGLGFDIGLPTASDDVLGTGKWTAGPSALYAYLGPKWKLGVLLQQYWDFAGDDDRPDVNTTNLQYMYYYSLDSTTSIGAGPNIIIDWEQDGVDRFTVPVGIGINKTINIGKVPVRFGTEAMYSVARPNDIAGVRWDFRFYAIAAVPSALFSWMQ